MSLRTQIDYWMVWTDVLLRGGRLALATQMCLHCIKVAESVQPPFAVCICIYVSHIMTD